MPESIEVQCLELKGDYMTGEHKVSCTCAKECAKKAGGAQLVSMSEFELHAGSRRKYWKESVSVAETGETLFSWVSDVQ